MRIAVDAMGGDDAPRVNVDGAIAAVREFGISCLLVGRAAELETLVRENGYSGPDIEIVDATEVVTMDDPATTPIRKKRNSSVRVAANCVRDGRAQGLVSAGHTGAAMVCAKMVVGMIEGVDRPALATVLPNLKGHCLLLDVGANPDTKTPHFREFAVMGSIYAELAFHKTAPSIGLMSIGEEDSKGTDKTKEAFKALKETGLNFIGNVEGRDVFNGSVDVIVTDGFTGNVILKVSEALAEMVQSMLREEIKRTLQASVGFLLSQGRLPPLQAARRLLGVRRGAAAGRQGLRHHLPRPFVGQGREERHQVRRRVLAPEPRREDPGPDRRAPRPRRAAGQGLTGAGP